METRFYNLKNLLEIKYGKSQKNIEEPCGKYPILGTGGVIGHTNQFLYDKPSVLIGRKGTIDKIQYIEQPFWTIDTLFYTIINEKLIIPKFLYYRLLLVDLTLYNEGTSIPSLTTKTLYKLEIDIPTVNIQKKILKILNNLDKKIEINKKINKNLDKILDLFFKKYYLDNFVNKVPDNWNITKIKDLPLIITDYVANGSFASLKNNVTILDHEDYSYFIRNTDLKNKRFKKYVNKHSYDYLNKSSLYGNELLISNVGDVGSVYLCPFLDKPMTLGNNMILVKSKKEAVANLNYYLFLLFRSKYGQFLLNSITTGSVQLKFNKTEFRSLKVIIPDDDNIIKFNKQIKPLFEYKRVISKEIESLSKLRDTLLPKLMSGELDVSGVDI
ncbi:restriction endonuclease subunit S [Methanosphaera sp. Vir-13MRS]|uniref:restriction endonuclease subunit S n=1 Tax=Candidatus Methanosphaera massiliense TaxID=3017187 RepID=UPI002380132F|nr:restriction endonuclease subunit S [Candidatus Methanosphaera massiliense]MDE4078413.1 restriction endonuclease subunit S [Candidatus Methanosphaera massiliense]